MERNKNLRMLDLTVRTALLIEAVKLGQTQQLNAVVSEAEREFKAVMQTVKYDSLGQLTKAELLLLLKAVRQSQSKVYGAYTKSFVKLLEAFMNAKCELDAIVLASNEFFGDDYEAPLSRTKAFNYIERVQKERKTWPLFGLLFLPSSAAKLWGKITNAPMPANGILPLKQIESIGLAQQVAFENAVRKAYANNSRTDQATAEILANRAKVSRSQGAAAIETVMAHVSETVYQAVASAIHEFYKWISVIDDVTTEICQHRNLKIFRYGVGPRPPAHYRCRSTTIPLADTVDDFKPPSLYNWLRQQPRDYVADLVGSKVADMLEDGRITAANFNIASIVKPVSISELVDKATLILNPRSGGTV